MAADGRILTSEILTDDNLDALIAKMRSLETVVASLTDAIRNNQTQAAQLEAATRALNTATSAGREQIVKNTKETDQLALANKRYNESLSEKGKQLAEIRAKITEQNRLNKLETQLVNAKTGSYNALSAQYSLNVQRLNAMSAAERKLTAEGQALTKSTSEIRAEMQKLQSSLGNNTLNVGNYSSAISGLKERFTDFIKGGFIVAGVAAIVQGVTQLGRRAIEVNKQVSDSLGDIQRIAQLSKAQVNEIFAGVEALDTRTGINDLLQLTAVGARLGVPRLELVGFTKALDSLKVALGSELGENAEEVATKVGKLTNIFEVGGEDTGEKFLRVGNAIVTLANEGVASGEFISDFSTRVAGIAEIADVSLGSVIGLGAGFEELGQSSEVAGTATTQLILKIGQDVPKYARLAGKSVEDFARTLSNNPVEALIQLAEGISTNKKNFAELSEAFKDAEARGVRVSATLGVLGTNAEFFRGKIESANEALNNTGQISLATAIKQETLAAQTAKLGTAFDELAANPSVESFFGKVVGFAADAITALDNFIKVSGGVGAALANLGRLSLGGQIVVSSDGAKGAKTGEELAGAFLKQSQGVDDLENKYQKLIRAYFDLDSIARKTPKQAQELADVTKQLAMLFPEAGYGVGKYGEALFINTDIASKAIDEQKKLADTIQKEAITALRAEAAGYEKSIAKGKERLEQLQAQAADGKNVGSQIVSTNEALQKNVALLDKTNANLALVMSGGVAAFNETKKAVVSSKEAIDSETLATQKNTKAKKDNLTAAEKLAIQASKELQYQRELQELLAKDSDLPLLQELAGGGVQGVADKFYSIGANVGAAFGEGFGDAEPLQSIFDANAEKDIKARAAKIGASAGDGLKSGIEDKLGIFDRLAQGESIYDLLGINVDDDEKAAIKSSFDFVKQQLDDFLSFRTQIANRNVQNADREVQAAQAALDNQIQLQAAGLANTVESRQRDLADAQANRERALRQQEKAARQEQLISGAQQGANLALALSKLFATNPILAIGLGALVIGSFVGFKIAAANASKRQYGQGDFQVLEGGSHASGNDIPLGTTRNGQQEYAEGGEGRMIIPKDATAKYRTLLPEIFQALKQKDFENQFQRIGRASAGIPLIVNVGGGTTINTGGIERRLDLLHKQGQEKTIIDGRGRMITTYKNLTQIREN